MPNIPTTGGRDHGSTFPPTAYVQRGACSGLCRRSALEVVPVLLELDLRGSGGAHELQLCAECLADFAVAQEIVRGRVYVLDRDREWRLVAATPKDGGSWSGPLADGGGRT